jgi:PAS domain S-box-containing protein
MFAGSFLNLLAIIALWPKRKGIGGKSFFIFLLATFEWTISASIEAAVISQASKIFWSKMEYVGLVFIPVLLLLFTLQYCKKGAWITPFRFALLALIPVVTLLLVWTNEFHYAYWPYFLPGPAAYNILIYGHGIPFFVFQAYLYLCCLASAAIMFYYWPKTRNLTRLQSIIMPLSMLFPGIGGLLYIVNLNPVQGLDWSPVGMTVSAVILTWGIRKQGLFDISPLVREKVFDLVQHAIVVLDNNGVIVDANPKARRMLKSSDLVGQSYQTSHFLVELLQYFEIDSPSATALQKIPSDGKFVFSEEASRTYSVTISTLYDQEMVIKGFLILLQDITAIEEAKETRRIQNEYLQMLIDVAPFRVAYLDLKGDFLLVNQNYADFFGIKVEEFLGKNYQDFLPEDYIQSSKPGIIAALQGHVVKDHKVVLRKNNEIYVTKVTYTPFFNNDHTIHSIGLYARDATQEWEKENYLLESQQLLEAELQKRTSDLKHVIEELETEIQLKETARAALHHMEETLVERVTTQSRKLAGLYEVILAGSQSEEPNQVLEHVLSQVIGAIDCQAASIHRVGESGLQLVAQKDLPVKTLTSVGLIPDEWLSARELPFLVQDISDEDDLPEFLKQSNFRSFMCAFIRQRDNAPALLGIYWDAAHSFSVEDISLVNAVAEELAVILENIDLRQRMESAITLKERRRLARDLHDSVTQSLHSLVLAAYAANNRLQQGNLDKLQVSLEQISDGAVQALKEMRLLLYEMRLVPLQDVDMVKAIQNRLEMVEGRAGIHTAFNVKDDAVWPKAWEGDLFCIITEALNNSLKYAQAHQIDITLYGNVTNFTLDIRDDGAGFDQAQGSNGGMGLKTMAERAERLGGKLIVESQPGSGTHLTFSKN